MNKETDVGVKIERVFDASLDDVWNFWTNPELIKKWWGPKDFTSPSIKIDLKEGGKYIYCMHGPKGSPFDMDMYDAGTFLEIVPKEKIVISDHFSDEKGGMVDPETVGMDPDMPSVMEATITFQDLGDDKTKLAIFYPKPESDARWKALLKSGMEEGWNQSLDKFAECLKNNKLSG